MIVLAGTVLAAAGSRLAGGRSGLASLAVALVAAGAASLWWVSALGGIGGDSGRSSWWLLMLLPYPIGWVLGIVSAARTLRRHSAGMKPVSD